jgi:hypothetical protein
VIRRFLWASLLLVCAFPACEQQPTAPQPGTLSVRLQNPNDGLDGAIMLTLSGPAAVSSVAAASGDTLWGGPYTSTSSRMVITGAVRSGVILTFSVPDVNAATQYTATVNQAAGSSDYTLRSVTSYTLTITK